MRLSMSNLRWLAGYAVVSFVLFALGVGRHSQKPLSGWSLWAATLGSTLFFAVVLAWPSKAQDSAPPAPSGDDKHLK